MNLIKDLKIGDKVKELECFLLRAFPITPLAEGNSVQNFSVKDTTGSWIRAAHFKVKLDLTKLEENTPLILKDVQVGERKSKNSDQSYPSILRCLVSVAEAPKEKPNKANASESLKEKKESTEPETSKGTLPAPLTEREKNEYYQKKDTVITKNSMLNESIALLTSPIYAEGKLDVNSILTIANLFYGWCTGIAHPEVEEKTMLILEIEQLIAENDFNKEIELDRSMLFAAPVSFLRDNLLIIKNILAKKKEEADKEENEKEKR